MKKLCVLVEGETEKAIIENFCKKKATVNRIHNGRSFRIDKMGERIVTILKNLKHDQFESIIILFDREKRNEKSSDIKKEILEILKSNKIDIGKIIVGIPDRNLESWLAPFISCEGDIIESPTSGFDGKLDGYKKIKERLAKKNLHFDKNVDSVNFYKKIIPSNLAKISDSFQSFHFDLQNHSGNTVISKCFWLNR